MWVASGKFPGGTGGGRCWARGPCTLHPACRTERRAAHHHPHPQEEHSSYHIGNKCKTKGLEVCRRRPQNTPQVPDRRGRALGPGNRTEHGSPGMNQFAVWSWETWWWCPEAMPASELGPFWSQWADFLGRWLSAQTMPVLPAHPLSGPDPQKR